MKFIITKIKGKELSVIFKDNYFSNNFLLTLFIAAFIVIAVDLGSDMAAEKDEIGIVLAILVESHSNIILTTDFLSDIKRPLLFEIPLNNSDPIESICNCSVKDRGPPEIS